MTFGNYMPGLFDKIAGLTSAQKREFNAQMRALSAAQPNEMLRSELALKKMIAKETDPASRNKLRGRLSGLQNVGFADKSQRKIRLKALQDKVTDAQNRVANAPIGSQVRGAWLKRLKQVKTFIPNFYRAEQAVGQRVNQVQAERAKIRNDRAQLGEKQKAQEAAKNAPMHIPATHPVMRNIADRQRDARELAKEQRLDAREKARTDAAAAADKANQEEARRQGRSRMLWGLGLGAPATLAAAALIHKKSRTSQEDLEEIQDELKAVNKPNPKPMPSPTTSPTSLPMTGGFNSF